MVRLVNKSTVIESGIRDVFFELTRYIVRFLLGPGWGFGGCLVHVCSKYRVSVRVRVSVF